jgi:hypothetical protein
MEQDRILYFHLNKNTDDVFYVGIGYPKRAYIKSNRSKYWKNYINKYDYSVSVIKENLTLEQAKLLEKFWIKTFGREDLGEGLLVNHTDGGDGIEGFKHSNSTKIKMSKSGGKHLIGKPSWSKGVKFSDEHKKKLSDSHKGNIPGNKGIYKFNLDEMYNLLNSGLSQAKIAKKLGVNQSNISRTLKNLK